MSSPTVASSDRATLGVALTSNLLLAVKGGADAWLRDGTATAVDLARGERIVRRSEPVPYVYFPETAVIGVVSEVADGRRLQALSIGREGSTAAVSLIDAERSIADIVVQLPGRAVRVASAALWAERDASPAFASAVRLHARRLFEEAQTCIACVNYHEARGRTATWLLSNAERFDFAPLPITHQLLSEILGVRRATISEISDELRAAGCVEYARASARVVDAEVLRAFCCPCYRPTAAFREEFVRLHDETLDEVRLAPQDARADVAPAVVADMREAYERAVQALSHRLNGGRRNALVDLVKAAPVELCAIERSVRAYVFALRDSRQPPETTLALVKRPIDLSPLSVTSREQLRGFALGWMIEAYYSEG